MQFYDPFSGFSPGPAAGVETDLVENVRRRAAMGDPQALMQIGALARMLGVPGHAPTGGEVVAQAQQRAPELYPGVTREQAIPDPPMPRAPQNHWETNPTNTVPTGATARRTLDAITGALQGTPETEAFSRGVPVSQIAEERLRGMLPPPADLPPPDFGAPPAAPQMMPPGPGASPRYLEGQMGGPPMDPGRALIQGRIPPAVGPRGEPMRGQPGQPPQFAPMPQGGGDMLAGADPFGIFGDRMERAYAPQPQPQPQQGAPQPAAQGRDYETVMNAAREGVRPTASVWSDLAEGGLAALVAQSRGASTTGMIGAGGLAALRNSDRDRQFDEQRGDRAETRAAAAWNAQENREARIATQQATLAQQAMLTRERIEAQRERTEMMLETRRQGQAIQREMAAGRMDEREGRLQLRQLENERRKTDDIADFVSKNAGSMPQDQLDKEIVRNWPDSRQAVSRVRDKAIELRKAVEARQMTIEQARQQFRDWTGGRGEL